MLDRRANLEAKLRRSRIVARQYALDEHDKMLRKPLEDTNENEQEFRPLLRISISRKWLRLLRVTLAM